MGGPDVIERHELRSRLQCQDFRWFLESVIKPADLSYLSPLGIYESIIGAGEIKNEAAAASQQNPRCLDADQINASINLKKCHGHGLGQYWMLTKSG